MKCDVCGQEKDTNPVKVAHNYTIDICMPCAVVALDSIRRQLMFIKVASDRRATNA